MYIQFNIVVVLFWHLKIHDGRRHRVALKVGTDGICISMTALDMLAGRALPYIKDTCLILCILLISCRE